jgi:hypothetical protein
MMCTPDTISRMDNSTSGASARDDKVRAAGPVQVPFRFTLLLQPTPLALSNEGID